MVEKQTGTFGRAVRIGRLGLGIAGSYVGYQIQNLYLNPEASRTKREGMNRNTSRKVREGLQALRGPVMKLGQTLSMQDQALPPEVIEELTALQMQAPPMHPTLMRIQVRKALGKNPEDLFRDFDPTPFAAASLGQVHHATTHQGEKVAVKIQYPAIREVIENDFKLLRTLFVPARMIGYVPPNAIDEVERGILEETDYINESRNIDLFRSGLKQLPYVQVPTVHPDLSTDTVLTMSHMPGSHLGEFLKSKPSQALRNKVGTRLIELFLHQLHGVQAMHADPHPGNYLFDRNGDIALLDFGCVKKLIPSTVKLVQQFAHRAWHEKAQFDDMVQRTFGKPGAPTPAHARKVMMQCIALFETLYPVDHTSRDGIDFGTPKTLDTLRELWNNAFRGKLLNPEFLFTSRAEMGVYNVLHTLKAKVPTTHTLTQVLQRLGKQTTPP